MRSLSALLGIGLLAACSSPTTPYKPQFGPVDSDGKVLRDATRRTLLLRGPTPRRGVFDVTFSDGRADAASSYPASTPATSPPMRAAGFTMVRLPIN